MRSLQLSKYLALALTPVLALVALWQIVANQNPRVAFLFGEPSQIAHIFWQRVLDGSMLSDIWATLLPVIIGFALGNIFGIVFGLLLWRFKTLNQIARPYLIAVGAVPAFIFAPVLVFWFGTGLGMRVVLVFLSTVLVATFQASTGASEIDSDLFRLFHTFQSKNIAVFQHLILPSAATWVFAGLRLNIGFALLGEFIGEFISSERGVAHQALVDAGLYNLSAVWVSACVIALLAAFLYICIVILEILLVPWKPKSEFSFEGKTFDLPLNRKLL